MQSAFPKKKSNYKLTQNGSVLSTSFVTKEDPSIAFSIIAEEIQKF